jgi:membrane fusion protein (multidrug efflux system)
MRFKNLALACGQIGRPLFLALLTFAALSACSKAEPPAPPPQEVATIIVTPQPAAVTEDYVAEAEAYNTVEIRPRVSGVLEKQLAVEGRRVNAGQVLFVIDQQPYAAALAQAKAALAQTVAAVEQSQRDLARAKPLTAIDALSQQELDAVVARNDANLASVDAAKAAVKTAELNLGYATVTSPIAGIMGRVQLRVGGLVSASSTLLTTVYANDPMYVNFSISEQRMLQIQKQFGRAPDQNSKTPPPFQLFLSDGSKYPLPPKLNFIDAAVDVRTGTLPIRLEVPNPQQLLHTGQFARVQVISLQDPNAIVLPQRSIQDLQGKKYVWIIDDAGKAQQRDVTLGPRIGNDWLIQDGLKPGDVVIVDGVQRLRPGAAVTAKSLQAPGDKSAGPSAGATKAGTGS